MKAVKVKDCTDIEELRSLVLDLYSLLDHIDTLDDSCRSNDRVFRDLTRATQKKRHNITSNDGYEIYVGGNLVFMKRSREDKK